MLWRLQFAVFARRSPMSYRPFFTTLLLGSAIFFAASCSESEQKQSVEQVSEPESGVDYHSFANTGDYRVKHIDLELTVDFSRKILAGTTTLQLIASMTTTTR
jgi:hypothetical protein